MLEEGVTVLTSKRGQRALGYDAGSEAAWGSLLLIAKPNLHGCGPKLAWAVTASSREGVFYV